MPRRTPNLQLRGSVYWLRVRVPDRLRAAVGKREIRKSLHTGDLQEAQVRCRQERVNLDRKWKAMLSQRITPVGAGDDARPLKKIAALSQAQRKRLVARWLVQAEAVGEQVDDEVELDDLEEDLAMVSDRRVVGPALNKAATKLLKDAGWLLEHGPSMVELQNDLQEAFIESERRILKRHFPNRAQPLNPKFATISARSILQPVSNTALRSVLEDIRADPSREKLRGKSVIKRDTQWRVLIDHFGADTPVEEITRHQVREFMNLLARLPSNAGKHFPKASLSEAADLGEAKNLPRLAPNTANAYLRQLGSVFRYAMNEGIVTYDPTPGMLLAKSGVRAKDARHPFTLQDLRAIFGAPLYTGCADDQSGYAKPGTARPRGGRFWVPLVALYTGMRLGEIIQLTLDDLVVRDGVDVVLIQGDDDEETKRVKTEAGHRFVPVHPMLRQIGLMDHVAQRRLAAPATAKVFPDIPNGRTHYPSDPFSKFFARFLDKVGVTDRKKVFHSFRHSYRDALREADISAEKVRALGGWASGRTEDDYGSGLKASTFARDIEKVGYDGLDLSHLYPEK